MPTRSPAPTMTRRGVLAAAARLPLYPVYGKTGTAEHLGQPDQSWYACYVDDPSRPLVVAVTIEKGGFGAATAAPAARLILSSWFHLSDASFHSGESTTR